jgi:DNA-binding NarL/FixJ family response regulator
MKNNKILRVTILEDSLYYNKLLSKELSGILEQLPLPKNISYNLESFHNYTEFLDNFNVETNIAFVDLNLDHNYSGIDVLNKIKTLSHSCAVVVISSEQNMYELYNCLHKGASGIIIKNENTFEICSYLINNQIDKLTA